MIWKQGDGDGDGNELSIFLQAITNYNEKMDEKLDKIKEEILEVSKEMRKHFSVLEQNDMQLSVRVEKIGELQSQINDIKTEIIDIKEAQRESDKRIDIHQITLNEYQEEKKSIAENKLDIGKQIIIIVLTLLLGVMATLLTKGFVSWVELKTDPIPIEKKANQ